VVDWTGLLLGSSDEKQTRSTNHEVIDLVDCEKPLRKIDQEKLILKIAVDGNNNFLYSTYYIYTWCIWLPKKTTCMTNISCNA
jgi:hypothetical protein